MRSEEIREDVELDRNWIPKRPWSFNWPQSNRRRVYERRGLGWARLIVLLVVTAPFGMMVFNFMNGIIRLWAGNGLNVFEILLIGIACWAVYYFYRWLIGLAR
ncbi:MAG: hypothetical protein V3U91_00235 [Candidatus Aminicenantaceae bacterium]